MSVLVALQGEQPTVLFGTEAASGAEEAVSLAAILAALDTGAGLEEAVTLVQLESFVTTDTGAGVEAAVVLAAAFAAADFADTGSGADLLTTLEAGALHVTTDAGTGADLFVTLDAGATNLATDSGVGIEVEPSTRTEADDAPRFHWLEAAIDAPVVAEALMENLVDQYGKDTGRQTYFAMEREAKGPFGPDMKYDAAERPPQPVIMVNSRSPRPNSAKPAPPAPTRAQVRRETALREFAAAALKKMGRG